MVADPSGTPRRWSTLWRTEHSSLSFTLTVKVNVPEYNRYEKLRVRLGQRYKIRKKIYISKKSVLKPTHFLVNHIYLLHLKLSCDEEKNLILIILGKMKAIYWMSTSEHGHSNIIVFMHGSSLPSFLTFAQSFYETQRKATEGGSHRIYLNI